MCGIAGISTLFEKDANFWKKWIYTFSEDIQHRGKDDAGILLMLRHSDPLPVLWGKEHYADSLQYIPQKSLLASLSDAVNGVLIHQRLAIIAPGDRSHQPMCDATGRYWITYNGEIFNYIELRQLYKLNTVTDSDTEVLLELWAKMEDKCLALLDGFFAFCIYDSLENTYTVVRDRTGVKPLYYGSRNDAFAFASEESTIRRFLQVKTANEDAAYLHVTQGMSDAVTWFEGVETLKPGHWLRWNPSVRSFIHRQWFFPESNLRIHENRNLEELLLDSMKKRLRSDVPLGFALSGGLDSTVILGLAKHLLGASESLKLFSVISPDHAESEHNWQQIVHKHYGGSLFTIDTRSFNSSTLEDQVLTSKRPAVAWNNVAHFEMCKTVREAGVTVLFNGQGADELYGGYPDHFIQAWLDDKNQILPHADQWPISFDKVKKIAWRRNMRQKLPPKWKNRMERFFWGHVFHKDLIKRNQRELHPKVENVQELMMGEYYGPIFQDKFYGRLYQMLQWEDRNGMAFQLESRNPFADDAYLPLLTLGKKSMLELMQGGRSKGLLREAAKSFIPEEIYHRSDKKGFTVPERKLTYAHGTEWESWVMSSSLDDLINRTYREKLVKQFSTLTPLQHGVYFRVATLGLFLERLDE
jgi:asparagine synthase (glutamine-hydrolysing)